MNSWPTWLPIIFLVLSASSFLIFGLFYENPVPFGMHLLINQYASINSLILLSIIIITWTTWLHWPYSSETFQAHYLFQENTVTATFQIITLITLMIILFQAFQFNASSAINEYELLSLILLAGLGSILLITANDLIPIYLAIEIQSFSFYILTSYNRFSDTSTEAGLNYFLLGALSSGFILFSISLYYGILGTTNLSQLQLLLTTPPTDPIHTGSLTLALIFLIGAFFFKLAIVPFHAWAPDIYQGAPTLITTYVATTPNISLWILFTNLLFITFQSWHTLWQYFLLAGIILSLSVAAFTALNQSNINSLLAYSTVNNTGFLLLGLAINTWSGVQTLLFYLIIYMIMVLGIFMIFLSISGLLEQSMPTTLNELTGLNSFEPALAFSLSTILFSLAGIPPLAGFFSKLYLFTSAIEASFYGITTVAILISVLAAFYYISIIQFMYFNDSHEFFYQTQLWALDNQNSIDLPNSIILSCILIFIIGLGLYTHPLDLITQF